MSQTFWVGTFPGLGEEHLEYIAQKLEDYFGIGF
jgi:CDP-6-deoxy-D-xylo-4-hexulose-3-dehydrase